MKNKKLLGFILAFVFVIPCAFILAACGKSQAKVTSISATLEEGYLVYAGESFDSSKVTVIAKYSDKTEKTIEHKYVNFGTLDTSKAGNQVLTIKFSNKSTTLTIEVLDKNPHTITCTQEKIKHAFVNNGNDFEAGVVDVNGKSSDKILQKGTYTLTAKVKRGFNFDGWYVGTTKVSTDTTYNAVIGDKDLTYTAKFAIKPEMASFEFVSTLDTLDITNCDSNSETITIPNGTTKLGDGTKKAFQYLPTTVVLPDGLQIINDKAFLEMYDLKNVNIPSSVTEIGYMAFSNAYSIKSIVLPNTLTTLGMRAFEKCSSLESINIPTSLVTIESYTFLEVPLKKIEIPGNIKIIDTYAFAGAGACSVDQEYSPIVIVKIAEGVETIKENAFNHSYNGSSDSRFSGVKSIILPKSLTKIETNSIHPGGADIYYAGSQQEFEASPIYTIVNEDLNNGNLYMYSQDKASGLWHYDNNGNPVVWGEQAVSIKAQLTEGYCVVKGDTLDTSKIVVTVTFDDDTTKQVTKNVTFGEIDTSSLGEKTVTITYQEKQTTLKVNVCEMARFIISSVFNITDKGIVLQGKVNNGEIKVNDILNIVHNGTVKTIVVKDIAKNNDNILKAIPADGEVQFLTNLATKEEASVGDMLISYTKTLNLVKKVYTGTVYVKTEAEGGKHTPMVTASDFSVYLGEFIGNGTITFSEQSLMPGSTNLNITLTFATNSALVIGDELLLRNGGKTIAVFTVTE